MSDLHTLTRTTRALFGALGGHAGWRRIDDPDLQLTLSPTAHPALNVVTGGTDVDRALSEAGGRGLLWKVLPDEADHAETLLRRGFHELPPSVPVVGPIPPEVLAIAAALPAARPVESDADLRAWLVPFGTTFGLGPAECDALHAGTLARGLHHGDVRHHVLFMDDAPVVSGTLVLDGSFGAVFNLAVHPSARRKGLGTAMLASLAREAHLRGADRLGQFSTPEGVPLYAPHGTVWADRPLRNFLWTGA